MIELIKDLPPSLLGFKATGKVTKNDYERVVFPQLEIYLKSFHTINYLFVMDTSVRFFTVGAWIEDTWLRIKKLYKWRRVAIISNQRNFRCLTEAVGHLFPGEYKGFSMAEVDIAVKWLTS
jgi:hypothetical protein